MTLETFALYAAATLVAIIGLGCAAGAFALRRGRPENWTNVVGSVEILRRVAVGLALVASLLFVSSGAVFAGARWGCAAAAISTGLFVVGGFWGNHAAFGDFRPMHTGTNVVVAAVVYVLLSIGC